MKHAHKLVIMIITLISSCNLSFAQDEHPQVYFGNYGIKHHPTLSGYMQYVGKTVKYMTEYTPSYNDQRSPFLYHNKFDTPFIITKITGSDDRMIFHMKEKDGKAKVKMYINNEHLPTSQSYYDIFCISSEYEGYTVPLVLVDELEKERAECIGKTIADKYEIVDFQMLYLEPKGYPIPCYVIMNKETNASFPVRYDADLNMLGHIYTNPKVKATYEVVNLVKVADDWEDNLVDGYSVKNSTTGEIFNVRARFADTDCFKDDLSGAYFATLTQVERPIDSSNRYGSTETIVDNGITKFSYIDEYIDILIYSSDNQFNFTLKNISTTSLKIIWNEAVFVDSDGSTSKIMHLGTKYSQREEDQPATIIIKGAKIEDVAVPTKNVRYSDILKEWITESIFPAEQAMDVEPLRLMLPIQVKETINEYIFVFNVEYIYDYPERLNL